MDLGKEKEKEFRHKVKRHFQNEVDNAKQSSVGLNSMRGKRKRKKRKVWLWQTYCILQKV